MPGFARQTVRVGVSLGCGDAIVYDVRKTVGELFGLPDRSAKRHGALGRARVGGEVYAAVRASLAQPIPASNHARAVVHVHAAFTVREQRVQLRASFPHIHIEDDYLVGRQDSQLNGLSETQPVKLGSIDGLVVHGRWLREVVFFGFAPRSVRVNARRSGHVQPFLGGYVTVVVDTGELRFYFRTTDSRSTMRLIANNKVEFGQPQFLSFRHLVERLVGRKNGGHGVFPVRVPETPRQLLRVGGSGFGQVVWRDVFVDGALSRFDVRTYRESLERNFGVVRPLYERLRQERYGRREKQNRPADARHPLRYPLRYERLARTASHDELAALALIESGDDGFDRFLLIRSKRLARFFRQRPRTREAEVFPVDGRILEHLRTPADDGLAASVAKGALGVSSPLGRRGDEHAFGELVGGVGGEELVEILERDGRVGRVELALNGDKPAAVALPRHDVYAGVLPTVSVGIFRPQPNPVEPPRLRLVHLDERLDQRLEHAPLLGRASGFGRQDVENALKRRRGFVFVLREEFGHSLLRIVQVHRLASIRAA